jgi:hypothetical protein
MSQTNSLPSGSHFISLSAAIDMTSLYRTERENVLASSYRSQGILPLSETFNRDAFDTLLAKGECAGIRLYYGMDENYKLHALIVAVNDDNEDLIPDTSSETVSIDVAEEGQRCPDLCPPTSLLNA